MGEVRQPAACLALGQGRSGSRGRAGTGAAFRGDRAGRLAADYTSRAHALHQPRDDAAGDVEPLPHHLPPDVARLVILKGGRRSLQGRARDALTTKIRASPPRGIRSASCSLPAQSESLLPSSLVQIAYGSMRNESRAQSGSGEKGRSVVLTRGSRAPEGNGGS